jgi:hydrogenase maturation factor
MMTKTAGIEGTAILAGSLAASGSKVDARLLGRAKRFIERMSVVEEADRAFRTGQVRAMHDCTEGGVLGSLYEMAVASELGFEVGEKEIPVASETNAICAALKANPLKLISSGSLLLAVKPGGESEVEMALATMGTRVTKIGKFLRGRRVLVHKDGREERIKTAATDEIWRLEECGLALLGAEVECDAIMLGSELRTLLVDCHSADRVFGHVCCSTALGGISVFRRFMEIRGQLE